MRGLIRFAVVGMALLGMLPTCCIHASDPHEDQTNAALLYYQAFMRLEGLSSEENQIFLSPMEEGIDFEKTEGLVKKYRESIRVAEIASMMPKCNFAFVPIEENNYAWRPYQVIRRLGQLVMFEARLCISRKEYQRAFDLSVTLRRFARQLNDRSNIMSVNMGRIVEQYSLDCLKALAEAGQHDQKILHSIRDLLLEDDAAQTYSYVKHLGAYRDYIIRNCPTDEEFRAKVEADRFLSRDLDREPLRTAMALRGEESVHYRIGAYIDYINSTVEIFKKGQSSLGIYNQMESLRIPYVDPNQYQLDFYGNVSGDICVHYLGYLKFVSYYNIVKNGVDIYLIIQKNGEVPQRLPKGLAIDPCTGKDLSYRLCANGFALGYDARQFHPNIDVGICETVFEVH